MAVLKYEPYITKLIIRWLGKNQKAVDVGANIGHFAVQMAKKVGKDGKVWAIEPEKTNFKILLKNLAENQTWNVKAIKAAAGKKNERKFLTISDNNMGDHRMFNIENGKEEKEGFAKIRQKVEVVCLDAILGKEKIDLMKIDVQGWEPEVIEGARFVIENCKPTIIMEFDLEMMREAGTDFKGLWRFLKINYGKIWILDEWAEFYYPARSMPANSTNILLMGNGQRGFGRKMLSDFKFKKWIKRKLSKIGYV